MENVNMEVPIKDIYKVHVYDENTNIKDIYIFSSGIKIPLEQLFNYFDLIIIKYAFKKTR